jgi:hypothetical protein
MIVCGHGNVKDFCDKYDMIVAATYEGEVEDYKGISPVLVTDQEMSENEYLYLKKKLLLNGVELISTEHTDEESIAKRLVYEVEREIERRKKYAGRCKFGFRRVNGEEVPCEEEMVVVRRIMELRDKRYTYEKIRNDEEVHGSDGRMLSISTVAWIVKNREIYGL